MAGLRSRSTRSAGYWNWHDWTARIEHLIPPRKQGLESQNPATRCVSRRGFLVGDRLGGPHDTEHETAGSVAPAVPTLPFKFNGAGTPPHSSPSGGVFLWAPDWATATPLDCRFTMWLPLLWSDHHCALRARTGTVGYWPRCRTMNRLPHVIVALRESAWPWQTRSRLSDAPTFLPFHVRAPSARFSAIRRGQCRAATCFNL